MSKAPGDDRRMRYEVVYTDATGAERSLGFTDDPRGQALLDTARIQKLRKPRVVDRGRGGRDRHGPWATS